MTDHRSDDSTASAYTVDQMRHNQIAAAIEAPPSIDVNRDYLDDEVTATTAGEDEKRTLLPNTDSLDVDEDDDNESVTLAGDEHLQEIISRKQGQNKVMDVDEESATTAGEEESKREKLQQQQKDPQEISQAPEEQQKKHQKHQSDLFNEATAFESDPRPSSFLVQGYPTQIDLGQVNLDSTTGKKNKKAIRYQNVVMDEDDVEFGGENDEVENYHIFTDHNIDSMIDEYDDPSIIIPHYQRYNHYPITKFEKHLLVIVCRKEEWHWALLEKGYGLGTILEIENDNSLSDDESYYAPKSFWRYVQFCCFS
jgi:hypothetical protein